jgi:ATP-dependent DNA helicase RecG
MVDTNDGFVIAEKDLEIRGPGEMEGTRQSGVLLFKLANLVEDKIMLEAAKNVVAHLFATDPALEKEEHQALKKHQDAQKTKIRWGKIA